MDSAGDPRSAPPAGVGTRAHAAQRMFVPGAIFIVLVALFFRGQNLDGGRMSPDDGEFLHSARAHELEPGVAPGRWLREDIEWAGMLAEDFGRIENRRSFQHGYLHQFCIRQAVRAGHMLGFGYVAALRLDQAIFGALTALLVMLWLRRVAPNEPLVAWAGGAFMAVQLVHVLKSRSGWGQAACTFFIVWMVMIAWRMFTEANERDTGKLLRGSIGIALTSLAAYGFHEMATVYTFVLAVLAVLLFRNAPDGTSRYPWRSKRVAFALAGCVPVGALTIALVAFSEYARETWFSGSFGGNFGWWERRTLAVEYWSVVDLPRQVSWPVLALAVAGLAGAFTRDMRWLVWLVAWTALPFALLFLKFNLPHLVRIYLPVDVVLVVLAAEGLGVLWGLARARVAVAAADGVAVCAIGWCACVTQGTVFDGPSSPFFVRAAHHPLPEGAHPMYGLHDIETVLRELQPDEPIAVAFTWGGLYRMLDLGYAAESVPLDARMTEGNAPKYVLGPPRQVEGGGRSKRDGGPYAQAAVDPYGQLALYVRE